MKKIGILVYDFNATGGAEKVAKNLAIELSKNYEVFVISLFESKKSDEKHEYKYFKMFDETISITKNLFKISRKLKKHLIENEIEDLLMITAGVNTVGILSTMGTKIKTIYCEHSNLENRTYGKKHLIRQWIGAKFSNKVITLTERDRNNFIKEMKLPENKVLVITNWFVPNGKLEQYNVESKKIITAGRLEKVKGHDLLIQVAKKVKEKHGDWIWEIYGDGKCAEEIRQSIVDNSLQDFVVLKGNVNNLNDLYADYSMFVLTSYYEGIPLVLLEAQQANLPIVSFDCPTGPSEIVDDNINGFIIPTYNTELMANKINELIESKDKRVQFSNNSKNNINKFDKAHIIKLWIELIENI